MFADNVNLQYIWSDKILNILFNPFAEAFETNIFTKMWRVLFVNTDRFYFYKYNLAKLQKENS